MLLRTLRLVLFRYICKGYVFYLCYLYPNPMDWLLQVNNNKYYSNVQKD